MHMLKEPNEIKNISILTYIFHNAIAVFLDNPRSLGMINL